VGEQLLDVRRDKRERAAYAAIDREGASTEEDRNAEDEDRFDTEEQIHFTEDED
jgi:hypothetical protein